MRQKQYFTKHNPNYACFHVHRASLPPVYFNFVVSIKYKNSDVWLTFWTQEPLYCKHNAPKVHLSPKHIGLWNNYISFNCRQIFRTVCQVLCCCAAHPSMGIQLRVAASNVPSEYSPERWELQRLKCFLLSVGVSEVPSHNTFHSIARKTIADFQRLLGLQNLLTLVNTSRVWG